MTPRGHHRGNSTERLLDKNLILQGLDIQTGQTVLDVGCGNGYMTKVFSSLVGEEGQVYGLDRSVEAIEWLKNDRGDSNIEFLAGDITQKTILEDNSIDLMYLSTVYHIFSHEEKAGFLREAERIMKPKGKIAIIEIEKRDTPFGPPRERRVSPEELIDEMNLSPLALKKVGEYFYMQLLTVNRSV
ncbi:MAG: class I SAM-dependent methyltransferase [Spirochaetales bacterium]|nr:class I SAM-dependent methyltransferase [Spirochaetales bacterium]